MESATIYLENLKDSTLINYTISDTKGNFNLEDKSYSKSVNLFISFIGYDTYFKKIDLKNPEIDLKTIQMKESLNTLDEIVIKSRAPITIKKDTLEFNVKSFKTKKDATVEDLLKKLPGVVVDEEGKITINGKPVSKILVNGQPFFGNDQTIVTRNLTKDIIEKIQVTDTKTKAQAFIGEEGDAKSKTINLTIKKENSKSVFGRIAAGLGTSKRYELAGIVSVFNDKQRLSVLGGSNNTNSPGFSFGDINRMARGRGGSYNVRGYRYGGNRGITTSKNGGVNYIDKFGNSTDLSSSYFLSGSNSESNSRSNRENFLPNSKYFTESNSNNYNETLNHRGNLGIDIKIDSTFLINIKPQFSYSKNLSENAHNELSKNAEKVLTNKSSTTSFAESITKNFTNSASFTKLLKTKGAFIKLYIKNGINSNEIDNYFNSKTNIYGITPNETTRNQFIDTQSNENKFTYSVRYQTPIVKENLFLELSYDYSKNKNENSRSTFNSNTEGKDYTVFNKDLSTDFEYFDKSRMTVAKLVYRKDKLYFTINGGYKFRTLENKDKLRPELSLTKNYQHFEQTINFRYKFNPSKSININYYSANTPPQISQLQPFEDVSNPLNIIKGNPSLKPSNRCVVNLWYQNYNMKKKSGFYMHSSGRILNNSIIQNSTIDENFVRTSTYTNVDGNYQLNGGLGYNLGVKIDSLKTMNITLGFNGSTRKSVNFNNNTQYASNNKTLSPSLGINYEWRNIMQLRTNYRVSFSNTTINLNNFKNQNYIVHNLSLISSTSFFNKIEWQNQVSFNYNTNIDPEFQKSAWFWNSTVSYSFAKDKGLLSLKAYDVLNQNTNTRRNATQFYIEDSQSTVLPQYFMLSFSWKFNTLQK